MPEKSASTTTIQFEALAAGVKLYYLKSVSSWPSSNFIHFSHNSFRPTIQFKALAAGVLPYSPLYTCFMFLNRTQALVLPTLVTIFTV